MKRLLRILGFVAMWVAIIGVILLLRMGSRVHREELMVSSVKITIESPNRDERLISEEMVRQMLKEAKIKIDDVPVKSLNIGYIEEVIGRNGFVERADLYVDYGGCVSIDVRERSALVRLLVDGYNCYITRDGFVFGSPKTTALDTQVITGGYRPIFKANYVGDIVSCTDALVEKLELEIERVEREKNPIYVREMENNDDRRAVRKRYINRSIWESKDDFDRRVAELREENRKLRELYAFRQKVIDGELKVLEDKQEGYRREQKKLRKKCDDIYNLITFVEMVEGDSFWRKEISQIDVSGGDDMRLRFAVRGRSFVVTFGELVGDKGVMRSKLTRLRNFYEEALPRVGWDKYREINIEFDNQVVCKR